jgi:L-arabinose transport system substrate-binding protein
MAKNKSGGFKMKRTVLILMILLIAVSVSFAGGTRQTSNQAPLIAYICKELTQEWFIGTSTAMKETVIARGARDLLLFDTQMNPARYIEALDAVISRGDVSVLIVTPPDQGLSQITVDRCRAAGIKVLANDDGLIDQNGRHIAPAQELNAYMVGLSIGEYLGNYYNTNNLHANYATTALMLIDIPELSSVVPRVNGTEDKFLELVPQFERSKVIRVDYNGTSDMAFNVASATITANPQITRWIVMAPNDEGAQGATRALEQANLDRNAVVAGVGGYLAKDEFKKTYSAFIATSYIDPLESGRVIANAAMDWHETGVVPFEQHKRAGDAFGVFPFNGTMVDRNNYRQVMGAAAN